MNKEFKVGDRVAHHSYQIESGRYDNYVTYGEVIDLSTVKNTVIVQWDKDARYPRYHDEPELLSVDKLYFENDYKEKNSELEKEFLELQKQVIEKISKIAADLKDVCQLTKKYSVKNLYHSEELIGAIESAGWNMSSHRC